MTWDGVKYPIRASKVDGFRTKSYDLLQFLSAPEDERKKRPKHVECYCSY